MGEIKARVDVLVEKLRDVAVEVRLEAIEELSAIDKEHALPALHWAIENELDEDVRNAARDAYQSLSKLEEAPPEEVDTATADKTRKLDRPKVKAVTLEEGAPNPAGRVSLKIGFGVAIVLIVWVFLQSGQDPGNVPPLFIWWPRVVGAISLLGLVLGIVGITMREEKHVPAIIGTVVNGLIFVIYISAILLPWLKGW